jgi:F-type H+-transporting ATPase subunit c
MSILAAVTGNLTDFGKALAFAFGVGLSALGAGLGLGNIFRATLESVARQPELSGELKGIMWIGFAVTEALVFYGLLGGLLAYILI